MPPRLFCFGLGYSAEALARILAVEGWSVAGTAQRPERLAELAARGYEAVAFDEDRDLPAGALDGVTHLLTSVPPGAAGDPFLARCREAILAQGGNLAWVGYLSTTGVYGDHGGAWVEEATPPTPSSPRTRRRAEAEQAWLALHRDHGLPVHIFRLAGIYGPGRNPLRDVRAGTARRLVKPGQLFGRIHVKDIARTLRASIARPDPGAIYNLSDNEPAAHDEVIAYACALLGVAPPPEIPVETVELSAFSRTVWADNKKVCNRRIREELGVELEYPTYREGLLGLLESELPPPCQSTHPTSPSAPPDPPAGSAGGRRT